MKRIFLIHGWGGTPEREWFPWLKSELEKQGLSVEVPLMPNTEYPVIDVWLNHLIEVVGQADEETYFVGHSVGCQTILRYLEKDGAKIGGAVFVAGWLSLIGLETEEEKTISKPWLETPVDISKVMKRLNRGVAIFSDDDYYVSLEENREKFEKDLGCRIVVEQHKGHFSESDGVTEVPSVLEAVMELIDSENRK
jgi:uncharacterized protein